MILQASNHLSEAPEPSSDHQEEVFAAVLAAYPRAPCPLLFAGARHCAQREDVRRLFPFVNKDSSPGVPWHRLETTKGALLENHGELIVDAVLARLAVLDSADLGGSVDPRALLDAGCCDPVRLFVKNEPHKVEKAVEGRWRLISSVSIVDELVERLLFSAQNELEIISWEVCPSKPGMGLSLESQTEALYASVEDKLDSASENDVIGWDFAVREFLMKMEAEARVRLAQASLHSSFARVVRNRLFCLARAVFALSNGVLYMQTVPGMVKSGSYITSSSNSRMRYMLSQLIGAKWAMAMGDDCVEDYVAQARERYEHFGFRLKLLKRCEDRVFEFCSHIFTKTKAIPLNHIKGTFRLLSDVPDFERYQQFRFEFRNSPHLLEMLEIVDDAWGGSPPPKLPQ